MNNIAVIDCASSRQTGYISGARIVKLLEKSFLSPGIEEEWLDKDDLANPPQPPADYPLHFVEYHLSNDEAERVRAALDIGHAALITIFPVPSYGLQDYYIDIE